MRIERVEEVTRLDTAERAALRAALQEREAEVACLRAEVSHLRASVEYLSAKIEKRIQRQKKLRQSLSWRITKPVRAMVGWVKAAERRLRRTVRWAVCADTQLAWLAKLLSRSNRLEVRRRWQSLRGMPLVHASSRRFRLVYISGEPTTPGHIYRVIRPAAAAEAAGAQTIWIQVKDIPARLAEIEVADALVIWRASWNVHTAAAIETARRSGTTIVFDIDDLLMDPDLARLDIIDGIRSQGFSEKMVRDFCSRMRTTMIAADLCIATTDELASHMQRAGKPTFVLPNGYDYASLANSRLAVRHRRAKGQGDGLVRIGYAGGTLTHQRDFKLCVAAVAEILRARSDCRLVVFRWGDGESAILDIDEFPALNGLEDRIEWRNYVTLQQLPNELARFDINLAPVEVNNPFCEAKSELKFFEAALVDVPTIASPTGPFRRAIRDGATGFLASTPDEWRDALMQLADDATLRRRIGSAARCDMLWKFGPEQRVEAMATLLDILRTNPRAPELATWRVALAEHMSADNSPALVSAGLAERNATLQRRRRSHDWLLMRWIQVLEKLRWGKSKPSEADEHHTLRHLLAHDRKRLRPETFDAAWYFDGNPDVAAAHADPFRHYVLHGAAEGREAPPGYLGNLPIAPKHD